MATRKDANPSVATYADHEVITPPHELRKAVALAGGATTTIRSRAPKRRWSSFRPSLSAWMQCRMRAARSGAAGRRAAWASPRRRTTRCSAPPTTSRAKPPPSAIPMSPASPKACAGCSNTRRKSTPHSAAAGRPARRRRARHRPRIRPSRRADVASALTRRLRDVTDEFLKRENSFRPDYLESIFAPPLVPGAGDRVSIRQSHGSVGLTPRTGLPDTLRRNAARSTIAPARRRTAAPLRARPRWQSGAAA